MGICFTTTLKENGASHGSTPDRSFVKIVCFDDEAKQASNIVSRIRRK